MNEQQMILFCMFQMFKTDMKILHWKAKGTDFDTMHKKVTDKYYEKMDNTADDIAETLLMRNVNPPNYMQVITFLSSREISLVLVKPDKDYLRDDIISHIDTIFGSILDQTKVLLASEEMQQPSNVGIKSYYENMYYEYDKERTYLNARRK